MFMIQRVIREPLTHFLFLGALIFALNEWRGVGRQEEGTKDRIEVSSGTITWLVEGFAKQWNRAPNETEMRDLINAHIREEVLYREALAIGLDRNDTIVRRRMAQKMEFLSQDINMSVEPEEVELIKYFTQNTARYAKPAKTNFQQVYFSKERRGDKLEADAKAALEALNKGADPETMGDPSLIPHAYDSADEIVMSATFGDNFANEISKMPEGKWCGPVGSAYGLHLILITKRSEPVAVAFETARADVLRDYFEERRQKANLDLIELLKEQYEVIIDESELSKAVTPLEATAIR